MADGVTVGSLADDLPPEERREVRTLADALRPALEALATPYTLTRWREEVRTLATATPTGFDALDDLGLTWGPGKLYAVAARPGAGKTAFLLEAAVRYLEANPDRHALFLSWEEPLSELVLRLVLRADAALTRTPSGAAFQGAPIYSATVRDYARGDVDLYGGTATRGRLEAAAERVGPLLERLHLVAGDDVGADVREVLHDVGTYLRTRGGEPAIGLVCVDYFQKLRRRGVYGSRQTELQAVADDLRRFALGTHLPLGGDETHAAPEAAHALPVLVGAQVARGKGEHPLGEDIREADDLLNDVAAVVALSWEVESNAAADPVRALRVSVPKHRGGRARPDEMAKITWQPARHYLDPKALQDSAGAVTWTPLEKAETAGNKPRKGGGVRPAATETF
jgi:replicative DNA helicase